MISRSDPSPTEPRWHWRNTRSLGWSIQWWVWPWCLGTGRDEDVYGGQRWVSVGPVTLILFFNIGNCSSESRLEAAFSLSETQAWDRACRFEGRAP